MVYKLEYVWLVYLNIKRYKLFEEKISQKNCFRRNVNFTFGKRGHFALYQLQAVALTSTKLKCKYKESEQHY